MVNIQSHQLDRIYSALGDATRRALLEQLREGPAPVSELARPQKMSLPGVIKHIGVLEQAGLVKKQKKGRVVHCQLDATALKNAAEWISRYEAFWSEQLTSLEDYLKELEKQGD